MSRIYVASSWRNVYQETVVKLLENAGHQVYDFKNPKGGLEGGGFTWREIDKGWGEWSTIEYRDKLLNSPVAAKGFLNDFRAMIWCDTCLLVMPCGRSAHLELGWCGGNGKRTMILLAEQQEPELMYLLSDNIFVSIDEVMKELEKD